MIDDIKRKDIKIRMRSITRPTSHTSFLIMRENAGPYSLVYHLSYNDDYTVNNEVDIYNIKTDETVFKKITRCDTLDIIDYIYDIKENELKSLYDTTGGLTLDGNQLFMLNFINKLKLATYFSEDCNG